MENLIRTLEERRASLLKRGSELAGVTRDRGLDALGRVRSGALDWHETLNAWRSELEARDTRWGRLVGLQVRVLGRFDQALVQFGERVRAEIERLSQLELTTSAQRIAAGPAEATPVEAKPAKKPAARASTSGATSKETAPKAKKSAAAKSKAAKSTATKPAAKATAQKARPAAKAKAKAKSTAQAAEAGKTKTAATHDAKTKATATEAETPANGARARRPSTRLVMPIADYDDLTAKEIVAELPRLTDAQCRTVLTHEQAHKARKTVITALQSRVSS